MKVLKTIFSILVSMKVALLILVAFAVAAAVGTFIENDYGNPVARAAIYNTWWFEGIFLLAFISLSYNIYRYKLWRKSKWPILIFHGSFLLVILGGALTRYFGYEGMLHIREGEANDRITSEDTWFTLAAGEEKKEWRERLSPITRSRFSHSIDLDGEKLRVRLTDYTHWATQSVVPSESTQAKPYIILKVAEEGTSGNSEVALGSGDVETIGSRTYAFGVPGAAEVLIKEEKGQVFMQVGEPVSSMNMALGTNKAFREKESIRLEAKTIYRFGATTIAMLNFLPAAGVKFVPAAQKTDVSALTLEFSWKGKKLTQTIAGSHSSEQRPVEVDIGGKKVRVGFGPVERMLPFSLYLSDFIMGRYPGSHAPSSYESKVIVKDGKTEFPYHIYMNHILVHKGLRFYQSSYDPDEKGTILSVARDPGKIPAYLGFFLMTVGFLLQPFASGSRYRKKLFPSSSSSSLIIGVVSVFLLTAGLNGSYAQGTQEIPAVSPEHAEKFAHLPVHDVQGRVKPAHTLAEEIVLKMTRKRELYGQSATQVLLGMIAHPEVWQNQKMIYVGRAELLEMLGLDAHAKVAAFNDFLDPDGAYALREQSEEANRLRPAERSQVQNKLIKLDERVSVAYTTMNGGSIRIFPVPDDPAGGWFSPEEPPAGVDHVKLVEALTLWDGYVKALRIGMESGNYTRADVMLEKIAALQKNWSVHPPSKTRLNVEKWMNELGLFYRIAPVYLFTGLILILILFLHLLYPGVNIRAFNITGWVIVLLAFAAHTVGLILRWIVAGHAPWSNGYESLVYIAWATALSALIFGKRSPFVIGATSLMAGLGLFVAHMSWMDPQVTTLVPVLKSYWLTIHVSVISGSYGFLALGMLLGFLSLILFILRSDKRPQVDRAIAELAHVKEMTLMVGLALLSIGNLLGAVWANESWGRYWSWDPKETWTFISIMVYSIVLHFRLVPGLKNLFVFSVGATVAYASVLMTYFGVNYYLSGLHSYAAGDPVPIPSFLYYSIATLVVVIALAARNTDARKPLKME